MTTSFAFELVSPERVVTRENVVLATIPGGEGDFGVLAGHAPMISTVRTGVVNICAENDNQVTGRFFVAGGFAEVTAERCTVLSEHAVAVADLDKAELEAEVQQLTKAIDLARAEDDRAALMRQQAVAVAKLAVLG